MGVSRYLVVKKQCPVGITEIIGIFFIFQWKFNITCNLSCKTIVTNKNYYSALYPTAIHIMILSWDLYLKHFKNLISEVHVSLKFKMTFTYPTLLILVSYFSLELPLFAHCGLVPPTFNCVSK